MLTDEQAAEIDAAYAALPGTKPDGYSWEYECNITNLTMWIDSQARKWSGMNWMRVTRRPEDLTVWLEFWKERPEKEAPFDPPYVSAEGKRGDMK